MIVPLINEMPGFGFAEAMEHGDGRVHRVGTVQITAANARRLEDLLRRGTSLVYSGPVWAGDHWRAETFPVMLSEANVSPEHSTLQFREEA
jgi:hypothetical protein